MPDTSVAADQERQFTRKAAAEYCQVHELTITRWARAGLLPAVRTPGGHRRYKESDLKAVMAGSEAGQ